MERIFINSQRLTWCCADYGMTLDDLAAEVGIAVATLEKVALGEVGLTFKQLTNVAEYFGRGVLFFLEDEPVRAESVHTPAFRTLANQKPELSVKVRGLIERVEKQRAVFLALKEELDDPDLPVFVPPDFPAADPRAAAAIARKWLGLSDRNDFDSYRAAIEDKGVLVFRSNGYNGKWQIAKDSPILGFTLYDEVCPVIVVKKLQWETQQSFTLMHELGHLLLHRTSSIDDEADMNSHQGHERDANLFAGLVLVPDEFLLRVNDNTRPADVDQYDDWLDWCRKAWGVSTEVVLRRLLDCGRLPRHNYVAYRAWRAALHIEQKDGGSRAFRNREPKHIFGDPFVRTVLGALNGRYITLAKASRYLDGLKITDLHQLERHYAGL